jgi:hypothetical protein
MPKPVDDPALLTPLHAKNAFYLVLAENDKVYWWKGLDTKAQHTNYSKGGVRKILLMEGRDNPKLMVLIKAMDAARYENVIDVLDEMAITNIQRFAIVDFTEDDKVRIAENVR